MVTTAKPALAAMALKRVAGPKREHVCRSSMRAGTAQWQPKHTHAQRVTAAAGELTLSGASKARALRAGPAAGEGVREVECA